MLLAKLTNIIFCWCPCKKNISTYHISFFFILPDTELLSSLQEPLCHNALLNSSHPGKEDGHCLKHWSGFLALSTTIRWIVMKFCTDIHGAQWMNTTEIGDPPSVPLVLTVTSGYCYPAKISTWTGWIGAKCSTDIHGFETMYPNSFGDPLTFPVVPPWGHNFNLSNPLVFEQNTWKTKDRLVKYTSLSLELNISPCV